LIAAWPASGCGPWQTVRGIPHQPAPAARSERMGRAQAGKEGGQVPGGDLGKDLVLEEEAPADRLRGKESVRWT